MNIETGIAELQQMIHQELDAQFGRSDSFRVDVEFDMIVKKYRIIVFYGDQWIFTEDASHPDRIVWRRQCERIATEIKNQVRKLALESV